MKKQGEDVWDVVRNGMVTDPNTKSKTNTHRHALIEALLPNSELVKGRFE